MRLLPLSSGGTAQCDDDTYERAIAMAPIWAVKSAGPHRRLSRKGYPYVRRAGVCIFLHHLALGLPPGTHNVCHINHDTHNSLRENLRYISDRRLAAASNVIDRPQRLDGGAPYKWVSETPSGKWEARLRERARTAMGQNALNPRVTLYCVRFKCARVAAIAANIAAKRHYGSAAHQNDVSAPCPGACCAIISRKDLAAE